MTIHPLGDTALIIDLADESSDADQLLALSLFAADAIERARLPGVVDVTSAYRSIALFFAPGQVEQNIKEKIRALILSKRARSRGKARRTEIPVCYDNEFALDLARVAGHTSLTGDGIIALHASTEYTVACIGFVPGFPFLAGLSEKLRVPRLESPRTKVPAGSVAIANAQAGIYPFESPGGWNVIGRTPLRLFDTNAQSPALLQPGDRVRFRRITRQEFERSFKENWK